MIDLAGARRFVESLYDSDTGAYRYTLDGPPTLYGTCFALMTLRYLGALDRIDPKTADFILGCQDPETGWFEGPEIVNWSPPVGAKHDREHILHHLAVHVLPVVQDNGLTLRYPLKEAHQFLDAAHLRNWLDRRDMQDDAWLEGNNILFIGQFIVYLRDVEKLTGAQRALDQWFEWLDQTVDPRTGLWGTDRNNSAFGAMCGGYHQLLVYYYENHPVKHPERLVDTVLALQHCDGGFSPEGGGGACEDVDAVDILVNLYKLNDYRREDILVSVKLCLDQLAAQQRPDGGFPYKQGKPWTHLGVPATSAEMNQSQAFATWFRVHTLALGQQILRDERPIGFNQALSMGWHRPWNAAISAYPKAHEATFVAELTRRATSKAKQDRVNHLKSRIKGKLARLLGRT